MRLPDEFINQYVTRPVDWGPLGYFTYKRTYSRDGEEWWQTCRRVVEGVYYWMMVHCIENERPWSEAKAQESAMKMYDLMFSMKFLPPGRGLWAMGTKVTEITGAALNNCGFASTEKSVVKAACWCMEMLMLGVGVGFDTLGRDIEVKKPDRNLRAKHFVGDSREGWAECLRLTMEPYFRSGAYWYEFDYSKVRPKGAPIKTFGGVASGPGPLRKLVGAVRRILDSRIGGTVGEAAIVDIINLVGKCVVAGNVRRSAEAALGCDTDVFRKLKDYREPHAIWDHDEEDGRPRDYVENHRWCSNNSVVNPSSYSDIAERITGGADLGVFWLENARAYARMGRRPDWSDINAKGCNPCFEQTLEDRELCCLVETFPSRCRDFYEYQQVLKYAYLYAKAVTLVPTHDRVTNQVMAQNRRIGCSQSGIVEAMQRHGVGVYFSKFCNQGYRYIQALDERYSEWLGVQRSIKTTSVKPSGSVSLLPGVTPGIHFDHSPFYWRTIRVDPSSEYLPALENAGYRIAEHNNQAVVYFPVRSPMSRHKGDVSVWEQMELAAQIQHYWADNQVSATFTFQNGMSPEAMQAALQLYSTRLKAAAFLRETGHGFVHAPYQEVTGEAYQAYVNHTRPLDLSRAGHEKSDLYCDGDKCELSITHSKR